MIKRNIVGKLSGSVLTKLSVNGTSILNGETQLSPNGGNVIWSWNTRYFGNSGNLSIGSQADNGFKLDVNGTTRLNGSVQIAPSGGDVLFSWNTRYFGATGNLSIGNQSDTGYKLYVNGTLLNKVSHVVQRTGVSLEKSIRVFDTSGSAVFEIATTQNATNTLVGSVVAEQIAGSAIENSAFGRASLFSLTTGSGNTSIGRSALTALTDGSANTGVGVNAGGGLQTAYNNVCIGVSSGRYISDGVTLNASGYDNVFIGNSSRPQGQGQNNQIVIGKDAIGNGSNTTVIGNASTLKSRIFGALTTDSLTLTTLSVAPANNATGVVGEIKICSDAIYVCTATNTWKKAPLNIY